MLSVVVPVYNEARSVELLYDEVASALDPLERAWEVVSRLCAEVQSPG